jgi:hypothetical protein
MKKRVLGTYAELKDKILLTGVYGEWRDLGNLKQYRTETGAILNWWESSKTIIFQGPHLAAVNLEAALSPAINGG